MQPLSSSAIYTRDGYSYMLYELKDSLWKIYVFAIITNNKLIIEKFDIYKFIQIAKRKFNLKD
jgi:hypothetical protein